MSFMLPEKKERNALSQVSIVKRTSQASIHAAVAERYYSIHEQNLNQEQAGLVLQIQ